MFGCKGTEFLETQAWIASSAKAFSQTEGEDGGNARTGAQGKDLKQFVISTSFAYNSCGGSIWG